MGTGQIFGRAMLFLGCALGLVGCAGSSSGVPTISGSGFPAVPADQAAAASDTGSAGPIQAPGAAVWGSAAPQYATTGGPTFLSDTPPPSGSFPVLSLGLQFTAGGVAPVSIGPGAVATVISVGPDYDDCVGVCPAANIQLVIPGANINATFQEPLTATLHSVSYLSFGVWGFSNIAGEGRTQVQSGAPLIEYLFGYETPPPAIPATGQASFAGRANGWVFAPVNGRVTEASFGGEANFSADFASGKLTGAFTGIKHSQALGPVLGAPWNDVSVSASIAAGSNRFTGSTAVTSAPVSSSPYILSGSATGHIDGAFFGPSAQQIGAVWTLSDGTAAAIGTVSASSPH